MSSLAIAVLLAADAGAPLPSNLGTHHHAITTSSPEAQREFDQGLTWVYGFNHDEAIRAFAAAAQADPRCASCFWGIAYANGPHINNPKLDRSHAAAAWEALVRAQALANKASPVEQALIRALAARYAADPGAPREPLDEAYAARMREVWKRFPRDADVGTLFAEAMMDLRPWDLWTQDGKAQPGTDELVRALETVLTLDPSHPGANHFYIHALEASPHPGRAAESAMRIATLVPGAGHLVHMPSHIFIRMGRYAEAAEANRQAIAVDREYESKAGPQGFYAMYVAHNFQFLWATDLWSGRHAEALQAEAGVRHALGPDMVASMPEMGDLVTCLTLYREVRFGEWKALLEAPAPPAAQELASAMWHFGRGTAFGALGRLDEAEAESAALNAAVESLSDAEVLASSHRALARVAAAILKGDLLARRGQLDVAVRVFHSAAQAEDHLKYNEPPDWILPARHAWAAALMRARRWEPAAEVLRTDLQRNPENGWALKGLSVALTAQHSPDAPPVLSRFETAWANADVRIDGPTF